MNNTNNVKRLLSFWYEPLDKKIDSNHAYNKLYNRAVQVGKQVKEYLEIWEVFQRVNGVDFNKQL